MSKPSLDYTILKATPDDVLGITDVLYKTWLSTYPNVEHRITVDDIEDLFKETLKGENLEKRRDAVKNIPPNQNRLVAKINNQVVGSSTVVIREEYNQLQSIYVLPEFQGNGIGKAFWNEHKKFLDPEKDTIVHVAVYNTNAIRFYESLGFVDTGKRFSEERFKMKSGSMIPEIELILRK